MIAGSIVLCVGSALLYTIEVDFGARRWVTYQLICGIGLGLGIQVPLTAVQVVLA